MKKIGTSCLLFISAFSSFLAAHDSEPAIPFERTHSHSDLEGHFHLGWESRYYSEGRDNLAGDSIFTSSAEFGFEHFSLGYWYAISPEQNYDEFQLSAAYTDHIGDFDYYFSFTHIELFNIFPTRQFDNEIGFGISYGELPYDLSIAFDAYYSLAVSGYFAELSLEHSKEITDKLSITTTGILGLNQGYIPNGHDGLNHLALRAGLEYALSDSLSISTHLTYSAPLNRDPNAPDDQFLTNFFHSGINLQWSF